MAGVTALMTLACVISIRRWVRVFRDNGTVAPTAAYPEIHMQVYSGALLLPLARVHMRRDARDIAHVVRLRLHA
jgi:hypothetical protein